MANITDLVVYLSTEKCVAWVGSGPSIEVGLPDWTELARRVLDACRQQKRAGYDTIEKLFQQGKYPEMFDRVARVYRPDVLHRFCSAALQDDGEMGPLYSELVRLGFISFFTTNYDDVLLRHLEKSGQAVYQYLNSDEELRAVDIDTTPAIVKLHGEFRHPVSVILTRHDYQTWYISGGKKTFQTFLESHLARDRIVFIGYSLADPEMKQIQERMAVNFRRQVPLIALMPNADKEHVDHWNTYYNVDVLSYRATGKDHSELRYILSTTSKVLAQGEVALPRESAEDLKKMQALYLWHRFSPTMAGEAPIDALQSVTLRLALDEGGVIQTRQILEQIEKGLGLTSKDASQDLKLAIERLVDAGWITKMDDGYLIPEGSRLTIEDHERRFNNMMSVFKHQALLDMSREGSIAEPAATQLTSAVVDTLMDIFEIRGREIVAMVFDDRPMNDTGLLGLIEAIWLRANSLDDTNLRYTLVRFILGLLSNPDGVYGHLLDYLARAFVCIQALRIDPNVNQIVSEVVSDRALILDANVLIPLTAIDEDRYEFVKGTVELARNVGMPLYTTMSFIEEMRRHAQWAAQHTRTFGEQSVEVLKASKGEGGYDANAYLRGFVGWRGQQGQGVAFPIYLRECFGGQANGNHLAEFFMRQYGIETIPDHVIQEIRNSHESEYMDSSSTLNQWNEERHSDNQKSPHRIQSEVEAFTLVSRWHETPASINIGASSRCSFLSLGSSLPRLGRSLPTPVRMISVTPQAIWEILRGLDSAPTTDTPDFRSLMLTSYFRLSGRFLDSRRYKQYFRPLIDAAERDYHEHRKVFQDILGLDLDTSLLDTYPEEEWPLVVQSLGEATSRKVLLDESRVVELSSQNEELVAKLRTFEETERKREAYKRTQRERKRKRRRTQRVSKGRGRSV